MVMTSLSSPAKTNIGQLVNNIVKAGQSKLALADYRARTDALDKGLKDLQVFFFSTQTDCFRHTCCVFIKLERTTHSPPDMQESFYWTQLYYTFWCLVLKKNIYCLSVVKLTYNAYLSPFFFFGSDWLTKTKLWNQIELRKARLLLILVWGARETLGSQSLDVRPSVNVS